MKAAIITALLCIAIMECGCVIVINEDDDNGEGHYDDDADTYLIVNVDVDGYNEEATHKDPPTKEVKSSATRTFKNETNTTLQVQVVVYTKVDFAISAFTDVRSGYNTSSTDDLILGDEAFGIESNVSAVYVRVSNVVVVTINDNGDYAVCKEVARKQVGVIVR